MFRTVKELICTMNRNILLVEPGFKTKFPPLGLMKISAYHKALGDNVRFIKGINNSVEFVSDGPLIGPASSEQTWDRIYVSTLFTYHWKVTVNTILHYKRLVKGNLDRIVVGGILATLMTDELWRATGIKPLTGVLSKPGILDKDNDLVVDEMIPDYNLFDDSSHKFSLINDSIFGYSTRGCPNKCEFCGVHTLEGRFKDYRGLVPYVQGIKDKYGDRPYLVLFDNNILASKRLERVVHDILELGFSKDNPFEYEYNKRIIKKQRRVDFNQGTDLRFMDRKKMKLLADLPLYPLRIAFDHVKDKDSYIEKVRLAAEFKITRLSNYILYNFDDTPEDLWRRLKINIDLNEELGLKIYSFPMKYIPLNAKDRSYISSPNWNWQFIRGVQRILNVLKGTVMTDEKFFYRAFGDSEEKFIEILHMPESIVMNRGMEPGPEEKDWIKKFRALSDSQRKCLLEIIFTNKRKADLLSAIPKIKEQKLKNILEYYLPKDNNLRLFEDF